MTNNNCIKCSALESYLTTLNKMESEVDDDDFKLLVQGLNIVMTVVNSALTENDKLKSKKSMTVSS